MKRKNNYKRCNNNEPNHKYLFFLMVAIIICIWLMFGNPPFNSGGMFLYNLLEIFQSPKIPNII
jgi:hypothetical protein